MKLHQPSFVNFTRHVLLLRMSSFQLLLKILMLSTCTPLHIGNNTAEKKFLGIFTVHKSCILVRSCLTNYDFLLLLVDSKLYWTFKNLKATWSELILILSLFWFRQRLHCFCPFGQGAWSLHQALPSAVWREWREYQDCTASIWYCCGHIWGGKDLQVLGRDAKHRKGNILPTV